MTKRPSKKPDPDPPRPKNPHAVALGKLGGSKGGKACAANMTPEQRSKRARKASLARWGKKRKRKRKGSP
jgi:hypothetical protein